MDGFLIKKPKLSEELSWPNTSAHGIDIKELLGLNTIFYRIDIIR